MLASEILKRLAISDSGFIFDPVTGESFTANLTALAILRLARNGESPRGLAEALTQEFEVEVEDAERDLIEFAGQLRRAIG
jgi:hypothetical protein